ncbi:MAG TPA: dienelactone hydrolase family protein [Candidatus Angelobacter sp.]|jgi:carboxymethylenebutenolidase|nr:dienelactone hydrolase family protein [Candidatus Angelobacter sp.]
MGKTIEFKRPDGKPCPGYLATTKDDTNAPGFVVIQEWWGLNDQIKRTADRLAEAGYRALVPDLYRGKVASAADEANHLMTNLNFPDAAGQDIRGAVQYLKQSSGKVVVGGFCLGGALTLLCAAHVPEMDAGACFYGIPPATSFDPKSIKIPLICHFANQDDWCTPAKANELEADLKKSKSKFEIHRYDAHHAFMNEARPEVYDAKSAKTAWDRTLTFLKQALA